MIARLAPSWSGQSLLLAAGLQPSRLVSHAAYCANRDIFCPLGDVCFMLHHRRRFAVGPALGGGATGLRQRTLLRWREQRVRRFSRVQIAWPLPLPSRVDVPSDREISDAQKVRAFNPQSRGIVHSVAWTRTSAGAMQRCRIPISRRPLRRRMCAASLLRWTILGSGSRLSSR